MLEGLYSAAAGLSAQQQRLDAIANDVANVNTSGYKRLRVAFRDLVYQEPGAGAGAGVRTGNGVAADMLGRSFEQGALRRTERPLDLAITGEGFFQVRLPDGRLALTRDGNLHADGQGRLRTAQGALLEPPLTIPAGVADDAIAVAQDGIVTAEGRPIGRVALVTVPAPGGLVSAGDNAYLPSAASGQPVAAGAARVEQGHVEASNVDIGDAMVDMMAAQRAFQLASKVIEVQDEAMGIANGVRR